MVKQFVCSTDDLGLLCQIAIKPIAAKDSAAEVPCRDVSEFSLVFEMLL